ncbi:HAMP domain-containing sensor histidine kinase [Arcobacter sp. LA11]|uniref:sensor histidine kinase n=1 Tax=Arcobacter sp. LA11 TaxID=1898176 RepID=UPI000933CF88|nr:sensor histidine kinase [Arcobacter sp. LA11]
MSFKYRFILSFVLLEIFFILLIVSVNFIAISDSSKSLTKDKIESNITFLEQLLKIPVSIYDTGTLDDLLKSTEDLKYINSIIVLDSTDRILSKKYNFKEEKIEQVLQNKENRELIVNDSTFEIRYKKMFEEETFLGSILIIFDTSSNTKFIKKNKTNTILIVLVEIIISTFLSYLIGSRLTLMLTELTQVAQDIGNKKDVSIPYLDKKDEIGLLSNSLDNMYKQLHESYINLKQLTIIQDKQKRELEQANKSKDDFLANMSHELKTPLNSINVISSVMMKNKDATLNEKQVKNLNIINNCGNDLLFLINDVLDISKLEAGEINLDCTTFNLHETILNIKDMFEPQVKNKNLEFVFKYDENVQIIYSDKQRIKQIIKNLLSNSLKFVEKGAIELIVKDSDKNFSILIKDDGIGIDDEKLLHIFDRFKQADSSTTRKYGGTGLGLAICKELTTLLEGTIKVKSKVGVGTIFKLTLPKNEDKVSNIVLEEKVKPIEIKSDTPKVKNSSIKSNIGKEKVLILNNDPLTFIDFVIKVKDSYDVNQIDSLVELIKEIKENKYLAIIVDTTKINQLDLKKVLSFIPSNLILINDEKVEIEQSIIEASMEQFVKPLDTNKLISYINTSKDNNGKV